MSNWNILVPISTGVLDVSPCQKGVGVRYRVTFTQMLVIVTLMVAVLVWPVTATFTVRRGLGLMLFAWLWLFGGNFVIAAWRWPRFVAAALATPSNSKSMASAVR